MLRQGARDRSEGCCDVGGQRKSLGALGRLQEALQCYDKALAIDPQNVSAREMIRKIRELSKLPNTSS